MDSISSLSKMKLKCEYCTSQFSRKKSLYVHVRKFHNREPIVKKDPVVKCDECETEFRQRKSLYAHIRNFHNREPIALKKNPVVKCDECETKFCNKKNMYAHVRKFHNKDAIFTKIKNKLIECSVCKKRFSYKSSLVKHEINIHKLIHRVDHDYVRQCGTRTSRLLCPHESCTEICVNYNSLINHLSTHDIDVEMEEHEFSSLESFQEWKDNIQQTEMSFYTRDSAPKKLVTVEAWNIIYHCHRSYSYVAKGKNIRSLKSIGSHKTGKACPSRMKVTVMHNLNQPSLIKVKYWKTHYGHDLNLGRVALDNKTKAEIAAKLIEGATFDDILNTVRDPIAENKHWISQRLSILTRKDLHNIVRDFNIDYCKKQDQNVIWLSKMQKTEGKPELYYEDQNSDETEDDLRLPDSSQMQESDDKSEMFNESESFDETDEVLILPDFSQDAVENTKKEMLIKKHDLIRSLLNKVDKISAKDFHTLERLADNIISLLNKDDPLHTTNNSAIEYSHE